jgi:hypothetical protein
LQLEGVLIDLSGVAARLDADEKFKLTYRFPVRSANGQVDYETREGRLLDVAEEAKLLYVSYEGDVIWVKVEEAIELVSEKE